MNTEIPKDEKAQGMSGKYRVTSKATCPKIRKSLVSLNNRRKGSVFGASRSKRAMKLGRLMRNRSCRGLICSELI